MGLGWRERYFNVYLRLLTKTAKSLGVLPALFPVAEIGAHSTVSGRVSQEFENQETLAFEEE